MDEANGVVHVEHAEILRLEPDALFALRRMLQSVRLEATQDDVAFVAVVVGYSDKPCQLQMTCVPHANVLNIARQLANSGKALDIQARAKMAELGQDAAPPPIQ
jgi:hypothetical protein